MVKTADQIRLDKAFYEKYDRLINEDKAVVNKSNHMIGNFGLFIALQSLMLWVFNDTLNSSPNALTYKIILGFINIAVAIYMINFVVKNKNSL